MFKEHAMQSPDSSCIPLLYTWPIPKLLYTMFTSVVDDSVCMSSDNVLVQSSKWLAQLHIDQQIGRRRFDKHQ